jgi:hypothetical protein
MAGADPFQTRMTMVPDAQQHDDHHAQHGHMAWSDILAPTGNDEMLACGNMNSKSLILSCFGTILLLHLIRYGMCLQLSLGTETLLKINVK